MSITLNIHGTKKIIVSQDDSNGSKWITLDFNGDDRNSVTVFDLTLLDLVNALEKALHKEDEGYSI